MLLEPSKKRVLAWEREALLAMDVVLALLLGENLLEWGGGLEEGGQKIGPDRRWADLFDGSKSMAGAVF